MLERRRGALGLACLAQDLFLATCAFFFAFFLRSRVWPTLLKTDLPKLGAVPSYLVFLALILVL